MLQAVVWDVHFLSWFAAHFLLPLPSFQIPLPHVVSPMGSIKQSGQKKRVSCNILCSVRILVKDRKVRVSTEEGHLKQKFWEQPWSEQNHGKGPREQQEMIYQLWPRVYKQPPKRGLLLTALIICPVLQLYGQRLKLEVMLDRAEGFVMMGGDPRVMQQLRGTGEMLRNLQPPECHCLSHAHSKHRGGGVGSWSWMCRGGWRITKCLFKAGPVAGCLVTRELFCGWVSSCRSVCMTGNIKMKPFVQKGASWQMHVITSEVPGVWVQGTLPFANASDAPHLNLFPWRTWHTMFFRGI